MADLFNALTPISGNEQRSRTLHTNASVKSFATAETHQHTQTAEILSLSSDLAAPSSPFLYEAERSSRSPTKLSSPYKNRENRAKSRSPQKVTLNDARPRFPLTEETLRANETSLETPRATQLKQGNPQNRNYSPSESCLSAFSAIPNADMTMFAKLGLSPSSKSPGKRGSHDEPSSPSRSRPNTPGTARRKRSQEFARTSSPDGEDGTMQLMDFTDQLDFAAHSSRSPLRTRNSPSKDSREMQYRHQHRLGSPTRDQAGFRPVTPGQARELTHLLDFDLPPAPTPRSMPSITPRELESLKAGLLSQISALKATLSGKEAEITALSAAASDAETRVGDALEQLREARGIKEALEQEKEDWDRRDKETQRVLREVRAQIHETEKDRAQTESRLAEAEKKAEDADMRAQEAESKVAAAAAGAEAARDGADGDVGTPGSGANQAVQAAVEKVARELHTLYKAKHETKVGQLKKSYEARWMKKTNSLQSEVDRLYKELQDSKMEIDGLRHELQESKLHGGRVDAMTTIDPSKLADIQAKEKEVTQLRDELEKSKAGLTRLQREKDEVEIRADQLASGAAGDSARTKDLESKVENLSFEICELKGSITHFKKELEMAREENSQLVATVDEFLSMGDDAAASSTTSTFMAPSEKRPPSSHSGNFSRPGSSLAGNFDADAPKPSGMKAPGKFGFGSSRIGMGPPEIKRNISGSRGLMSNIEKMGRPRGADH